MGLVAGCGWIDGGLARARNGGFGEAETSDDAVAAGGENAVVEREDLGDAERGESAAASRREEFLRSVGGGDAGRGRAVEGGAGVEIAVEIAGDDERVDFAVNGGDGGDGGVSARRRAPEDGGVGGAAEHA